MNIMTIDGYRAVIAYNEDSDSFRGEFLGLNGGADFYGKTIHELRKEGAASLKVFLQTCAEHGVDPVRHFSGKFNARISPELHGLAAEVAAAKGISLNQLVESAIQHEILAEA